jgi:predicted nucleic acid-binding protein
VIPTPAYLDTNVLILGMRDAHKPGNDCTRLLKALESGTERAFLDPVVVHESTYALLRIFKHLPREGVASTLVSVVNWPGIAGEKDVLVRTLELWGNTSGLGFADALLAVRAQLVGAQVYTKNVRELRSVGATVPDPLPG